MPFHSRNPRNKGKKSEATCGTWFQIAFPHYLHYHNKILTMKIKHSDTKQLSYMEKKPFIFM